jgi:hypothetical protein
MFKQFTRGIGVAVFLGLLVCCSAGSAQIAFNVTLDTSTLGGFPGPFAIDFQLNDGSGTGDANNTATITNFLFGGGAPSGSPVLSGGATGDLSSSVVITDSDFFNDFNQGFTPGSSLSFDVYLTTSVDAGGTPDQFSFAIFNNGEEIPTIGPADVLVSVYIDSGIPVVTAFSSDPSRTNISIPVPAIRFIGTQVPEPGVTSLIAAGILSGCILGRRRRARWDG